MPSTTKKLMGFTLKLISTAVLWIGTAALSKIHLAPDAKDWAATLSQLPLWVLIFLIILLPVAWLIVEFLATCFLEVRARVLEHAAPRFAKFLTEIPSAAYAVLCFWWDSCLGTFERWKFDGRYRKLIGEECQQLHSQTGLLHATAGFSFEQAYTELNMASSQYGEINPGLLASNIRGRENIYSFLRMQQPGTALALLGRPGGGKTTLLRHLGLLYSRNSQGQHRLRRRIPVIIELRRVTELFANKEGAKWKSPTLIQLIEHYWKQHSALGGLMAKAPKDWLKRHLASGRVLVMVDGLDEVPHRRSANKPNILTVRQRVSQWMEKEMQRSGQRECLFLITSRPGGFAEAPLKTRVTVVEVQPLTLEQSERFIYAFQFSCQRKEHPTARMCQLESGAARATEKLQQELRGKPHLAELRVNPLLLHMVCLLHHLRGRLPSDRADLYKETCDVLLNRDLRAPGIEERLRPEDKLAALRPLADYFMRSQSPEAKSTRELLPVIESVFDTLDFPASDFFDFAAKDSGLLQEVEEGRWDFAHKTFYEYLTAEHWERHPPSKNELAGWVEQDWWRLTLLFYSAKSEDSPVIATALACRKSKAWSLAFACLTAGHRINSSERIIANTQLEKALSNPLKEDSFKSAAQALLDLQMRDAVSASQDGKWLRRNKFITQAEYQLFLLSWSTTDRPYMVPPHWKNHVFTGDPHSSIVGITPLQAVLFAEWARNSGEQGWVLPQLGIKGTELPDGCWLVCKEEGYPSEAQAQIADHAAKIKEAIQRWASGDGLRYIDSFSWVSLLYPHKSYERPANLRERIGSMKYILPIRLYRRGFHLHHKFFIGERVIVELNSAIKMALLNEASWPTRFSDSPHALLGKLINRRNMTRVIDLGEAASSGLGLEENEKLMEVFINQKSENLKKEVVLGDYYLCKSLATALAFSVGEVVLATALLHYKGKTHLPEINRLITRVETQIHNLNQSQFKSVNVCQLRLLACAARVVTTESDLLSHRHAWCRYGVCLAEICLEHANDSVVHLIEQSYFSLKMIDARADGNLEPWEKIMLVRQM